MYLDSECQHNLNISNVKKRYFSWRNTSNCLVNLNQDIDICVMRGRAQPDGEGVLRFGNFVHFDGKEIKL